LDIRLTTCSENKYCYEIQRSNGRTVRNTIRYEVRGEKLEECCKEWGLLAEASEEGLGLEGAAVPMMMMLIIIL